MSNMRIKKHKGVKLTDTRHPPPKKNREGDDEEEKLLQCIMCNCMTIEEYLKRHIRYNHLISKDEIIDKLYNLHYPPQQVSVSTQTTSGTSAPEPSKRDDFDRHKKPILKNRIKTEKIVEADDEEVLCPACGDVEDGTPMVACGVCDSWYHWVCVGLHTKPAKGTEWLCTSCSGKAGSSKGKRTNVPEAGARRMSSPEDEPSSSKGIPARQKVHAQKHYSSDEDDEPRLKGRKDDRFKKKGGPSLKNKIKTENNYTNKSEFSDDDDDLHDDLRYSDDSLQDKDFEPQESDYDEQDMNLLPERKFTPGEREQKKKKKVRMSNPPTEDDYDDMSRDDLRKLCHKEMINATGNRMELVTRLKRHFKNKELRKAKEEKKPKPKKYKLVEMTSGDGLCKICGLGWDLPDDLELGPLYKYGVCQAHLHCLMFSSGLIQGGDETEGIVGFMPADVDRECERGAKLKCCFCREIYATVGCCQRTCMKTYHLPCGIKFGALNEYYGNFDSYCPSHRAKREFKAQKTKGKNYVLTDLGLVPEHVDREAGFDSEKYKEMLRKIEKQYGEKKKTKEEEVIKKEKPEPMVEVKSRPGPKSKTVHMRKKKLEEEEEEDEQRFIKKKKKSEEEEEKDEPRAGPKSKTVHMRKKKFEEEEEEEDEQRPGPKSKTMHMRKKKFEEEEEEEEQRFVKKKKSEEEEEEEEQRFVKKKKKSEEEEEEDEQRFVKKKKKSESPPPPPPSTSGYNERKDESRARRGTRERKPFGSDIYKSAKEELEAMLKKKEMVNLSDTFTNLAGTRRTTKSMYNKAIGEDDDDDEWNASRRTKKAKAAKRAMVEVDDEDDEEDFRSKSFLSKSPGRRPSRKSPRSDSEEDSKGFSKTVKKKKTKSSESPVNSEEEEFTRSVRSIKIKPMPERKTNHESDEENSTRPSRNRKVLTPDPKENESEEDETRTSRSRKSTPEMETRRKSGSKSRKVLTPEPRQNESDEDKTKTSTSRKSTPEMQTRRKSGSRSRKVLTPEINDDDLNDNSKRSSRNRKVLTPENRGSDSEDGGRKVGSKSNNPDSKTGELRSDEDNDRESLRAKNNVTPDKKENSTDDETRRAVRGKKVKDLDSDIETSKSTRSEMFLSSQPTHSDTDDESHRHSSRSLSNNKIFENDGVTNEPLSEFLVDTRIKKTKKESSESGSDSGKKIKMVKKKKIIVDSDDEGFSPILENEFEDTENDSVHLAQNDGFLDASGIGSSNGSDEGADIEKPNFNDEEDEDNFDLSDIITKLDVQFEDDPSHRKIDHCYRFKCKLCGLDSNSRDKLEDHFKSCHHNKIPQKILTKQEMAIHIHRKKLSAEDKEMAEAMVAAMGRPKLSPKDKDKLVETMKARKEAKKKAKKGVARQPSPLELTGEAYPFFKYASDDVTEPMVDKEKTICIFDRSSRSPQNDMNDDNIESLLDEDPLKEEVPTKKVGRSRYTERKVDSKSKEMDPNITTTTKSITAKDDDVKDEDDEITKNSRQKTTVGKDFVLWANDIKETSGRSSRSSKSSFKKSDDEISNCEEISSGRSSRGSNRGKKKISLTRSRKEKADREQSPNEDSISDTNSDKKDDDDFINRRKSPSNMILMNRDALSPVPNTGISGPVFECLKCGTKLIQRKDLVLNHLKSHKLNFESYIDIYVEQASSSKLSAVIEWRAEDLPAKNEDLFNSLMAEGPICPPHLGPKFGTKPEPEQKESGSSGPKLGNTSLLCEDKGERDSASKFKVLYSTLDGGGSQDQSSETSQDHLSSALSSILSDEEKQELLLSPLKKTLKSAGIEVEEKDGAEKQKFVLRVKLNKH